MSKVAIEGNVSGTGTLTIAAPNTNTNRTLTLPDATGTLALAGAAPDKIEEGDSKVEVTDTGTGKVEITVDAVEVADFTTGAIVFNETGANQDFRVEGDTDANLLFVDASADNVGIGTSSPTARLTAIGSATLIGATNVCARFSDATNSTLVISHPASNGSTAVIVGNAQLGLATSDGTTTTERARITSDGGFLVGCTATPSGSIGGSGFILGTNGRRPLHLATTVTFGNTLVVFTNPNGLVGAISTDGSSTLFQTSSDYRLKHDIQPMTGALAKVQQLKPVTYKWNADDSAGEGFIAHELQQVVPDCVSGEKDAVETYTDEEGVEQTRPVHQGVDTSFLVATLTAAIQELKVELDQAKTRIAALENNNA